MQELQDLSAIGITNRPAAGVPAPGGAPASSPGAGGALLSRSLPPANPSCPPVTGGDDQRFGQHTRGLRPGENQRHRHLQQPAAEQEAQESRCGGQGRLDGLPESVKRHGGAVAARAAEDSGKERRGIIADVNERQIHTSRGRMLVRCGDINVSSASSVLRAFIFVCFFFLDHTCF